MGRPHSVDARRPTKATLFFSIDEIRALHQRFRTIVPLDHVVFEDCFQAYCLWSHICQPETSKVLFRAFDVLKRGFFDFEDFAQTAGALARGTSDQVSDVLFRMLSAGPLHSPVVGGGDATTAATTSATATTTAKDGGGEFVVRYQDVIDSLKALDVSFLCLRCDGGTTAQSVAARMPFDEFGHLPIEELRKKVEQRL